MIIMKGLYLWICSINKILWSRVVASTNLNIESVCVFRIITGVVLLAVYHPTFSWIAHAPQAFFKPPFLSIAYFTSGFPRKGFLLSIDFILLFTNVLIITGFKAKTTTLLYVLCSLIGFSYQYSFGKIDHNILLYAMLFCMAFSGWGTKLAILPDKISTSHSVSRSLSLLSVLICFAFFTAGFEKALNWIDFNTSSNGFASWYYNNFYGNGRNYLLAPFIKSVPFTLLEFVDYITPAFELSPLLFLLSSGKAWRYWLLAACMFHIITTLILNITFIWNFIVYLSFIDFSRLMVIKRKRIAQLMLIISVGILGLLIVVRVNDIIHYQLSGFAFVPDAFFEANLIIALIIWMVTSFIIIKNLSGKKLLPPCSITTQ